MNYMSKNFHYMLTVCGVTATTLAEQEAQCSSPLLSKNTILKFKDHVEVSKVKPSTIHQMAQLYNKRMGTSITAEEFQNKDLGAAKTQSVHVNCMLRDLVGDYVAFYLDSNGSGDVLGMFLRIEEKDARIVAHAIHKIRNLDALTEFDADDLFVGDIEANLSKLMKRYQNKRRNSRYFFGTVEALDTTAEINIAAKAGIPKCQIWLDMKGYCEERDRRSDGYRGGLGLAVATNSRGTFAIRFGLVKKCLATNVFVSNKEYLQEMLKTGTDYNNGEWFPLKLSKTLDSRWYSEFISCYEREEAQRNLT